MKKFKIKSNKLQLIICITITLILSMASGYLCSSTAFQQGSKHLPESSLATRTSGYVFVPNNKAALSAMDLKLKEDDKLYTGYISNKAKLDTKVNGDNKLSQSVILLSDTLSKERLTNKTYNGEIEEGYYPIYVEGFRWKKFKAGDKVSFELNDKSGNTQKINAIICGDFFGERLPVLLEGYDFLKTGSGVFAVEGLDISNYVDEPYEKVVISTVRSAIHLQEFGSPNKEEGVSYTMESLYLYNNLKNIGNNSIYLLGILLVTFFVLILLLGGKYASFAIVGFGAINLIVALLTTYAKFVKNMLFFGFSYYYYQWFFALSLGIFGVCLLIFTLLFAFGYKKDTKITKKGEQINANTPKYL